MFDFLLAIDPVAFQIFGLDVRWYALCILCGAFLTLFFSQRIIRSYGYGKELLNDMFLYALIGGLIGTRIWYILANLHEFLQAGNIFEIIWAMISVWDGGLAIQGGVLLGTACGFWFLFKYYPDVKKYPKALMADIIIPNILIAQVLGRWGNFFNQEVYGKCVDSSSWEFLPEFIIDQMSVCHSPADIAVPLFLIEGVINFVGWILITFVLRYCWMKRKDGYLAAIYFIWYGVVRLCLEPLRDASFQMSVGAEGIPTSMVMSSLYVIGGILVILLINYNAKRKDLYGQIEEPKEVLKKNILTLSIANAYYKMRTTKYLSRNLENNNYGLDTFMASVCPFYWFKFYEKYGEMCINELNERGLIAEGYESNEAFKQDLKNKCYIPFMASYVLAKGMNTLYANDLGE